MDNLIAIDTYGSQRVKHPHTGQRVSAYKMGYSSAASVVLLALYGDKARDVSSKQASYHYIQVDAEVTVRHGHILLKVTDAELAQAEALTRQSHRPAVYRWQDGAWFEFPKLTLPGHNSNIFSLRLPSSLHKTSHSSKRQTDRVHSGMGQHQAAAPCWSKDPPLQPSATPNGN